MYAVPDLTFCDTTLLPGKALSSLMVLFGVLGVLGGQRL
jgi:hypothetical protein